MTETYDNDSKVSRPKTLDDCTVEEWSEASRRVMQNKNRIVRSTSCLPDEEWWDIYYDNLHKGSRKTIQEAEDLMLVYTKTGNDYIIKHGGKRDEFPTGAVRDTQDGKGRYDLLPPRAIHLVAKRFQEGADHYGDRNWERGIPIGRILDSGLRHAFKALAGDTSEDHLVAAAWNFLAAIEMREMVKAGLLPEEIGKI